MIAVNKERSIAVVYSCGICNLNCRYCTIDKNPILKEIDKELEESFKGDYYFNRIKEYFPRRDQLKSLETWGGEPFLRMDRIYPLVRKLIDYYPYFNHMYSSSNFSYDEWIDQFMGLMNLLGEYSYREFNYTLQLSVDGPPYINDANRGEGVSERCIKNFNKLVQLIRVGKFPSNITLEIAIKGTWDTECIYKLNSKEKLIEFFKFYEDTYISPIAQLNNPKIFVGNTVPNMAVPSPATKKDGETFANLVKMCREIEVENVTKHYFNFYTVITPFYAWNPCNACNRYSQDVACCGTGKSMIGLLPHNMVSVCHEGFTLLVDKYKEYAANRSDKDMTVNLNKFFELQAIPMCLTDDQNVEHERRMKYLNENSTVQMTNATAMVMALAAAGLIEPQYLNEERALYAAKYVSMNTTYCIKASYAVHGTFLLEPPGLYILLLNGALEYIDQGGFNNGNPT